MPHQLSPILLLAVMGGGALGATLRYCVGIAVAGLYQGSFPLGTLVINASGSFLLGGLAELFALRGQAPQALQLFLTVGICGGYTTFSTFSLESFALLNKGEFDGALLYTGLSVFLSIAAFAAGRWIVQQFG